MFLSGELVSMSLVKVDIAAEASKYEIFDVITQIDRFNFLTGKTCRY